MAFTPTTMRRTGIDFINADGSFSPLWLYGSNDDNDAIVAANYFNAYVDKLKVGDLIWAQIDLDGTRTMKMYKVTANNGTAVTVVAFA